MARWLWVSGWAFPVAETLRIARARWPKVEHTVLAPNRLCLAKLREALVVGDYERLVGYSLGTQLLLAQRDSLPEIPIVLFAPIFDFKAEAGMGGRIAVRRLDVLIRWLRRDPRAAVEDFGRRAGMRARPEYTELGDAPEDLIWGIEQLRDTGAAPPGDGVVGAIGEKDLLLDAARMAELWPSLKIIAGAGHDLEDLVWEAD